MIKIAKKMNIFLNLHVLHKLHILHAFRGV